MFVLGSFHSEKGRIRQFLNAGKVFTMLNAAFHFPRRIFLAILTALEEASSSRRHDGFGLISSSPGLQEPRRLREAILNFLGLVSSHNLPRQVSYD